MIINKYQAHLLVLPEGDRNRQIVNGFLMDPALQQRRVQVLPLAHGWSKVLKSFQSQHVEELRRYPLRHLVLLIDFDNSVEDRLAHFRDAFPEDVAGRVYLLGSVDEPEGLKTAVGYSFERIGEELARACVRGEAGLWEHRMLRHNRPELDRLIAQVKPFLFE